VQGNVLGLLQALNVQFTDLKTVRKVCSQDIAWKQTLFVIMETIPIITCPQKQTQNQDTNKPSQMDQIQRFFRRSCYNQLLIGQVSFKPPKQEGEQRQKQPHPHHPTQCQ
jgi:hypothetical protein